MFVFVAGRQNAEVRRDGFKDVLVPLELNEEVLGLVVPDNETAEIHHEDGRIERMMPGDLVVEWPDGSVKGMPREVAFRIFNDPTLADDQGTTPEREPGEADDVDFISTPIPEKRYTDIGNGQTEAVGPDGQDSEGKTGRELQRELEERQTKLLRSWAAEAVDKGLIGMEEASNWSQTGEKPAGILVSKDEDGNWVVGRELGNDAVGAGTEQSEQKEEEQDHLAELHGGKVAAKKVATKADASGSGKSEQPEEIQTDKGDAVPQVKDAGKNVKDPAPETETGTTKRP